MLELRDYQVEMYDQARDLRVNQKARSMILQSPTGSGKTVLAASLLKNCADKGFNAWFLCHRREILKQSLLKLREAGVPAGIVAAGMPTNNLAPVQVCSIGSLARRHHALRRPQLIVYDECHHTAASSWAAIHAAYPDAVHIGLSATPQRLDGTGLGKWFEHMVLGPSTHQLITDGWLSPYRLFAPRPPDLSDVSILAGDYNKKELSATMDRSAVAGDTVRLYQKHVPNETAIVYMWSVPSSIEIAQRFNDAGIPAVHIDGDTDDRVRDRAIDMFRAGDVRVLCNVDIVGEGFDTPACGAGFFCRPTASLTLYLQQVGRILRPSPGKTAFLFDQAGNSRRMGLPDEDREWSLDATRKKKKKKRDDEDAVRVCPACTETWGMHVRVCRCGYVLVKPREMDVDEHAELEEVRRTAVHQRLNEQKAARELEYLIAHGRKKGYKHPALWAKHIIQARNEKAARRVVAREPKLDDLLAAQAQEEAWLF
jgi:superfamily II DNA or RNA helicase